MAKPMKTYLIFDELHTAPGAYSFWNVRSLQTGVRLGAIQWRAQKRKYAFVPLDGVVYYESNYLLEIAHFLERLMAERQA